MLNIISGGDCLEDIELLRQDDAYLRAVNATRIPDPTTAGDFLRRFKGQDIHTLIDINNEMNIDIWKAAKVDRCEALIDIDGTIQQTYGECKEQMDMSYKGKWGFNPLILTEANSGVHLAAVNRPGNVHSADGAVPWIDRAIAVTKSYFRKVLLRGDSAFSLTREFDRWDDEGVEFVFSFDCMDNLEKRADLLAKRAWRRVPHQKTRRHTHANVKREAIARRGYKHFRSKREWIGEFSYRPSKCRKQYRMVVIKRELEISFGQKLMMPEYRYFFYITNNQERTPLQILDLIHRRCNHENKIEQLDNGVHALKMPAAEFHANGAYMVICAMAWNLKAWLGLLMPNAERGAQVVRMEFKRFRHWLIDIPCQIVRQAGYVIYRYIAYNPWLEDILRLFDRISKLRFAGA
jgi:hypothetical protein